jgi:hypothetical protein
MPKPKAKRKSMSQGSERGFFMLLHGALCIQQSQKKPSPGAGKESDNLFFIGFNP